MSRPWGDDAAGLRAAWPSSLGVGALGWAAKPRALPRPPGGRRLPGLRAAPLLALLLPAFGCGARRELVERLEVRAEGLRDDAVLGLTPEAARASLTAAVQSSPPFKLLEPTAGAPEGQAPWRLQLELHRAQPPQRQQGVEQVEGVLQLRRRPDGLVYEVEAVGEVKSEGGVEGDQVAARAAASQAIAEVVAKAAALLKAAARKDEALIPELDAKAAAVREAAIWVLSERGNRAVGPALVKQLEVRDARVQRLALGRLIALKDPSTVEALIEASRARDPVFQRELVFAIAAIGGEEAEAYLFTMASGADHPVLKASAEQALAELKARTATDGGSP